MKQALRRTLTACTLAAAFGAPAADNSEAIFSRALSYTVQIRTAVATPLEGDLKGTQRGAGFIVDAERGWVMTNAHVVSRSPSRVEVAFQDQSYSEAEKIYVDPHLDLAIVRVAIPQGQRVNAATLECGELPRVGHPVGAFGHPWNMRFTGTRGIVSGMTSRMYTELLQTDAPINQGNSGGPLISLDTGRIVGINTAQIKGSQNTNFAVGMKYACRVMELLRAGRDPSPPALPVVYFNDQDDERVLKVARNYEGSSAIDLRAGDIIRGVVGVAESVQNETQLYHALRGRLGSFSLKVERAGTEITVTGSALPHALALDVQGVVAGGVFFAPTPMRDVAEVRVGTLMVHYVERGSDGDAKELRRGDFLEAMDGEAVSSLEQLQERLMAAGGNVTLTLKRYSGGDRVFTYIERRLRIDDVQRVGRSPTPGAIGMARGVGNPATRN